MRKILSFIWKKIGEYAGLLDNLLQDILGDLKSFRVLLVLIATMLCIYVLKTDPTQFKYAVALMATAYGFFFSSKFLEHKVADAKTAEIEEEEPPATPDRDPDNI